MAIQVGDTLPDATFKVMTENGPADRTTADVFAGKTVAFFAVPGAFTPTCHMNHLPGYLQNLDAIKAKGVDAIAVTAVNDVFVMNQWAKSTGADGKIHFLADGSAAFAKAIGLELDASAFGMGMRSKRYAMIVKDRKVTWLGVEDAPGKAVASGADALIAAL
jgi:peroxiredoxin